MGILERPQELDELMAQVRAEVNLRRAAEKLPPLGEPGGTGVFRRTPETTGNLLELRGDIETDGILARIRAELAQRNQLPPAPAVATRASSRADTQGRDGARSSRHEPSFVLPRLPVVQQAELETREAYRLTDFTALHDAIFLKAAYRVLLGRQAESGGFEHYLQGLRSGRLGKVDILGRLRYSSEGRRRAVLVHGLLPRYLGRLVFRVPLIGIVARSAYYMLRAPAIARGLEQLQTYSEERTRLGAIQANMAIEAIEQALAQSQQLVRDVHARLQSQQERFEGGTRGELAGLAARVDQVGAAAAQLAGMTDKLESSAKQLRVDFETAIARVDPSAGIPDDFYAPFEDRFRGTREDITGRVRVYLPLIREVAAGSSDRPILDLGCGRGEWLQVLREEGLTARGIDLNAGMVERSRELGLEVEYGDAIAALRAMPPESLGAVTAFHMVEHIPFGAVVALFDEALRCLKPGGIVLFETPNPENLIVGACNFYYDPTHRNPIPPEALRYVAEVRGFVDARIHRLHPPAVTPEEGMDSLPERVRAAFLSAQDYSIIARKP